MLRHIAYGFISHTDRYLRPFTLTVGIEYTYLQRHREMSLALMIERQHHRHGTEIRKNISFGYVARIGIDIVRTIIINHFIRPRTRCDASKPACSTNILSKVDTLDKEILDFIQD